MKIHISRINKVIKSIAINKIKIRKRIRYANINQNIFSSNRRIIDSILFFNELDLLELRFNILNNYVDYFVISESTKTHSGKLKPLYYYENKDRFKKFNHKIIHNIIDYEDDEINDISTGNRFHTKLDDIDVNSGLKFSEISIGYLRSLFERDCTVYGLLQIRPKLNDSDIIISSDADEIINPDLLQRVSWINPSKLYVCLQNAYFYKLNYLYYNNWRGSRVTSWKMIKSTSINNLRDQSNSKAIPVKNGGWHWSWLGDSMNFREKLLAQSEEESATKTNLSQIEDRINKGLDPIGRSLQLKSVPIDESFPKYLLANINRYRRFVQPWE